MHYLEMNQRQRVDHFVSRMNHADVGSPEYNLCEKIIRNLCAGLQAEEKLQQIDTPFVSQTEPIQESRKTAWRFAREALPRNY